MAVGQLAAWRAAITNKQGLYSHKNARRTCTVEITNDLHMYVFGVIVHGNNWLDASRSALLLHQRASLVIPADHLAVNSRSLGQRQRILRDFQAGHRA